MVHSKFFYVDQATGGPYKRNNIIDFRKVRVPDVADCFITVFAFDESFKAHVTSTGSVSGASDFPCWSHSIHWDIDNEGDLKRSFTDALTLTEYICSIHSDLSPSVLFSGNKGVHIHLSLAGLDLEPAIGFYNVIKKIALAIAHDAGITADKVVYDAPRLWRLPNTKHGASGLYKVLLTPAQLKKLASGKLDIKKIAAKPKSEPAMHIAKPNSNAAGKALKASVAHCLVPHISSQESTVGAAWPETVGEQDKTDRFRPVDMTRFSRLLEVGVTKGSRNNEAAITAIAARQLDKTRDEAKEALLEWDQQNTPPLGERVIKRTVESIYKGPCKKIGTGHSERFDEADDYARIKHGLISKKDRVDPALMSHSQDPLITVQDYRDGIMHFAVRGEDSRPWILQSDGEYFPLSDAPKRNLLFNKVDTVFQVKAAFVD